MFGTGPAQAWAIKLRRGKWVNLDNRRELVD